MSKKKKKLIRKSALKGANSKALEKSNGADVKKEEKKTEEKETKKKKGFARRESPLRKRREMAAKMIAKQSFTDEEIRTAINEAYPNNVEATKEMQMKAISGIRYHIRHGKFLPEIPKKNFERVVEFNGKKIPFSQKPKATKKAKPKYDEKSDPLNTVAGINVHKKKKKVKKQ